MFNKIAIIILKIYKTCLSPLLGSNCRFTPSCSTYAMLAFKKHGFVRAMLLIGKRLIKCNPFHPGGFDPV